MGSIGKVKSECTIYKRSPTTTTSKLPLARTPPVATPNTERKCLSTRRKFQIGDGRPPLTTSTSNMAVKYMYKAEAGDSPQLCSYFPDKPAEGTSAKYLLVNACIENNRFWSHPRWKKGITKLATTLFGLLRLIIIVACSFATFVFPLYLWKYVMLYKAKHLLPLRIAEKIVTYATPDLTLELNSTNQQENNMLVQSNPYAITELGSSSFFELIQRALGFVCGWLGSLIWMLEE